MSMSEQRLRVLKAIAASAGNGLTASQIVRASWDWPVEHRVWSAQSAAAIARYLDRFGYVRPERHRALTFYRVTGMGRGYLSVEDPSRDRPRVEKDRGNG